MAGKGINIGGTLASIGKIFLAREERKMEEAKNAAIAEQNLRSARLQQAQLQSEFERSQARAQQWLYASVGLVGALALFMLLRRK